MPKCVGCGFLSLRNKNTLLLVCADDFHRISDPVDPGIAAELNERYADFQPYLICARGVPDFWPKDEEVFAAINRERKCEKHTDWQPAMLPKEHLEMIQEKELRAWHEQQASLANRRANQSLCVALFGIVIGSLISLYAVSNHKEPPVVNVVVPASAQTKADPPVINVIVPSEAAKLPPNTTSGPP